MTVEDPVEYNLAGINQVQMHEEIGLTFAAALRSFLRQDPDIIMVGEIRDFETAEIAIKAALTGHLVLSTLHTNDAPGHHHPPAEHGHRAVPRLLLASIVIVAQRLARRICVGCKEPVEVNPQALDRASASRPRRPRRCTVYQGHGLRDLRRAPATRGASRSTRSCR